jgi:hypothetical protein
LFPLALPVPFAVPLAAPDAFEDESAVAADCEEPLASAFFAAEACAFVEDELSAFDAAIAATFAAEFLFDDAVWDAFADAVVSMLPAVFAAA